MSPACASGTPSDYLLTTHHKITMVALHSGFNSPSRFYQTFQNIVGCNPPSTANELARLDDGPAAKATLR